MLHLVYDLKTAQINVQCSLIQELMLYEFKKDNNLAEATKNICYRKGEGAIDLSIVTRLFKKFPSGYKEECPHDVMVKA